MQTRAILEHRPTGERLLVCISARYAQSLNITKIIADSRRRSSTHRDQERRGTLWVHGAFEPATGEATCLLSPRRDSATHIQLLAQMTLTFPAKRWLVIEDNLSSHKSRDVQAALLAWPEIQIHYRPKYACWLNLIEPWWK